MSEYPDQDFPDNYTHLPQTDWYKAPIEAQETTASSILEGVPTWICFDEDKKEYFVSQTSGQGPYIVWRSGDKSRANQPIQLFNFIFADETSDPEMIKEEIESWRRS
jgi:hypothetical protein